MKMSEIVIDRQIGTPERGPYPPSLNDILSAPMAEAAFSEMSSWDEYAPTPLHQLPSMAHALQLSALTYKDEGQRFDLGSFRALGGAYAVLRLAVAHLEGMTGTRPSLSSIHGGAYVDALGSMTVAAATDGNHGPSVAWGARLAGYKCRIYLPKSASPALRDRIAAQGATVTVVDGGLEAADRVCADTARAEGWAVVSDSSYGGRSTVPGEVLAGYSVVASETLAQSAAPATHVFVQAGIGGLAASVAARLWQVLGSRRPKLIIVEAADSARMIDRCRALNDRPPGGPPLTGSEPSDMSQLAWEVLSRAGHAFLTVDRRAVGPVTRLLAEGAAEVPVSAGETAGLGLLAIIGAASDPSLREMLDLGTDSRVLTIGSERPHDEEQASAVLNTSDPRDDARLSDLHYPNP